MKAQLTFSNRNIEVKEISTLLDSNKKEVRFTLTSIIGKYYNIFDKINKENIEIVGVLNFKKWALSNEYLTDF